MSIAEQRASLEAHGYVEIPESKVLGGDVIRPGDRVHNRGEQYPEAHRNGTATVVAIYEKSPSSWAKKYGHPDIEVITQRDRDPEGVCHMPWANYGTVAVPPTP